MWPAEAHVVRMGDMSYSAAIVEFLAEAIAMHDITWLEEPYRSMIEKPSKIKGIELCRNCSWRARA